MPTEYEIVTSKLLSYTGEGFTGKRFELDVPLLDWYARFQQDSALTCTSWETFRDPRETTYTKYTEIQRNKEIFIDGILEEIEATDYDRKLSPQWVHVLSRVVAPLRYPGHGYQMIASYIGQMAPSGRIVITAALQAADEMRRVQRIAYRVRQLQDVHRDFAGDSKALWQSDTLWQPLRMAIEKLLVCYDWAESFVALNLVLKPLMDELFMNYLSELALREGDYLAGQVFYSLNEDCRWHREWSQALTRMAIEENSRNTDIIQGWIEKWHPVAARALQAFAPVFEGQLEDAHMAPLEGLSQSLDAYYRDFLSAMGLEPPMRDAGPRPA
ncbi:MAG TPA: toluene hydroxylase [Candidatus Limnocylindria bacterium]|nr:toluene hydroxylase [Candidatus Limnocylindria bacterium]